MVVFTSKRLHNKAQGRRFGAPWVNGRLPRLLYREAVTQSGGPSMPLSLHIVRIAPGFSRIEPFAKMRMKKYKIDYDERYVWD
jgi:hypothetical protein